VFQTGIVTAVHLLEDHGLGNVRLFTDDARLVLDLLGDSSIGRAFILFPDPWPKARHHKRRLIRPETMDELARVLADGSELRIATDDVAYLEAILADACGHQDFEWTARRPADWRQRPADWPPTRYEVKAIAAGRPPAFLRLVRRPRPAV
jgi:tRNA (guanine-N7-)-methyltransferase